jgi:hypothetical protein
MLRALSAKEVAFSALWHEQPAREEIRVIIKLILRVGWF